MAALPQAVVTLQSSARIPSWVIWLGLIFFICALVATVRAVVNRNADLSRRGDPWPSWQHTDGKDAYEAATDPGIPAVTDDTHDGVPVSATTWMEAMTAPAPPIEAKVTDLETVESWYELGHRVRNTIDRADRVLASR